jgi:hypothetical protein
MIVSKLRGTSWFNSFSDIPKWLEVEGIDEQIRYIPVQDNVRVIGKCKKTNSALKK